MSSTTNWDCAFSNWSGYSDGQSSFDVSIYLLKCCSCLNTKHCHSTVTLRYYTISLPIWRNLWTAPVLYLTQNPMYRWTLTPTGETFTGNFARNYRQICRNQKVRKLWIYHVSLTQITQETSTCDDRTLGLLFTSRMRRLYGFQNDRILLSPPVLEKNLLRSVPQKICLSHCDTSFECLACQLMAGSMYSVRSCEEYDDTWIYACEEA